jgi:hypothetical protein
MEALRSAASALGQGHIFENWLDLSSEEQEELLEDVKGIDLQYVTNVYKASTDAAGESKNR